jgi:hypothetical protein
VSEDPQCRFAALGLTQPAIAAAAKRKRHAQRGKKASRVLAFLLMSGRRCVQHPGLPMPRVDEAIL